MKRKGLIYKATDTVIGKSYIGQTLSTFENRKKQHLKHAFNKLDRTYFTTFYKMLRFLGEDKFEWSILEEGIPEEELNQKEIKYIKEYNSYDEGYNSSMGGQATHTSILTKDQVNEIRKLLKESDDNMKEIGKKYGVKRDVISDINCGETWYNPSITYPIRPMGFNKPINFSDEQIKEMISMLKDNSNTYKAIANHFNCHPNSVKKINDGIHYRVDGIQYPIRQKMFNQLTEDQVNQIVEYLKTTDLSQAKIAELIGTERKNVGNINRGLYNVDKIKDKTITFPIRK